MISSISVSGFRSLQGFVLDFRHGLNVLVGPNAAGKSNIINFFNFLRLIAENPLAVAIASAGGAASVFTKVGPDEYQRSLSASINGILPSTGNETKHYKYTFTIELTQTRHQIYFSSQHIAIGSISPDGKFNEERSMLVEAVVTSEERLVTSAKSRGFGSTNGPFDDEQIGGVLRAFGASDQSLILISRILPLTDNGIGIVHADLLGTSIFSVIPSNVKASEDTVRPPGIAADGSGVAASLRALQIGDLFFRNSRRSFEENNKSGSKQAKVLLDRIIETIQLAVPQITAVEVTSDPFAAQLECNVVFSGANKTMIRMPLAQVSDGTAKWISLVTALFTSNSGISLEEPENFLHPHMQREIVTLMREKCAIDSFVLMTTHSETVLNAVKPDEVIVVSYRNDRTFAGRATNAALLMEQINKTGFGLGYYYLVEAIEST
jgi:predicted ATPase